LLLIAANVALLMFARAATREAEIAVRAALGAGRARIVGQLFAESLVLGALAAGLGLAAASAGLRWVFGIVAREYGGRLPFWFHASLSPETVVYAGALTLVGATLAGVPPGLKVTQGLGDRLRGSTAGGGGLKFGGVWTAVIVAQVAITMPVPALIMALDGERSQIEDAALAVPTEEYLAFRVEMEAGSNVDRSTLVERYASTVGELERRLEADPGVVSVTAASGLPRMYHAWRPVEVLEDAPAPPEGDDRGHIASPAYVALDYFETLGAPLVAGRSFSSADQVPEARTVIVNASFVRNVLGGRNAIGRHVRYRARPEAPTTTDGPWYQIIGVVPDLGTRSGAGPHGNHGIYHPLERSRYPIWVAAHVRGAPMDFTREIREIAQRIDPALEIHSPMPLAEVARSDVNFYDFWITLVIVVCVIAVVLSLAGVYAAMSFAVSRRTREIGIRVALGAGRRGIVLSIFRRPLLQIGAGILLGTVLTSSIFAEGQESPLVFVGSFIVAMAGVTSLACIVPTRRALAVEPSEALRSE
jgi:predicted permease